MHKTKYILSDGKNSPQLLKIVPALKKLKLHSHINTEQN